MTTQEQERISPFGRVLRRAAGMLEAVRSRLVLDDEVARMDDRAVADTGLRRRELAAIARAGSRPKRLMGAMMERVGVRPDDLRRVPGLKRDVERTCAMCSVKRRCEHWLETPEPADAYRRFCPNATSFEAVRQAVWPKGPRQARLS